MDIQVLRERIQRGDYLVKSHAIQHAIKEGFDQKNMVEAVLGGRIIEEYPEASRVLICGEVRLLGSIGVYLHLVCEYADPVYLEFVTAYIPDETAWEWPPFRRRRRR